MTSRTIPALKKGDNVRFLSPASPPDRKSVENCAEIISQWGVNVEFGDHIFSRHGFMAGTDCNRLYDLNSALLNHDVRAIFATRGGKGAYRIADKIDFAAARNDPKFLVGFSEITILHLALLKNAGIAGVHGPMVSWSSDYINEWSIDRLRRVLMTDDDILLERNISEPTASLSTQGKASGPLIGGNLDMISTSLGWAMPPLDGAILLLEASSMGRGQLDRQLTMLLNSGSLSGLKGVVLGQFTEFAEVHDDWTFIDILRDRLNQLSVPILGGINVGHGTNPDSLPIGTMATMDASAGLLTVSSVAFIGRRESNPTIAPPEERGEVPRP